MSNSSEFIHGEGSKLDYGIDWTNWLTGDETISNSVWEEVTGLVFTAPAVTGAGKVTSVFAEGGDAGKSYKLYNTITTTAGRIDSRTLTLTCKRR